MSVLFDEDVRGVRRVRRHSVRRFGFRSSRGVRGGAVGAVGAVGVAGSPPRQAPALRRRGAEPLRPPTRSRVEIGRVRPRGPVSCASGGVSRRWVGLLALGVAVCAGVLGVGALGQGLAGSRASVPAETALVSVGAGETVSDMASRFAPDSEAAAVVHRIEELNGLDGAALLPGMVLVVPRQEGVSAPMG